MRLLDCHLRAELGDGLGGWAAELAAWHGKIAAVKSSTGTRDRTRDPCGMTVPIPQPLGCLASLHGPPVPMHNTKQYTPPGGRVVTAQPAGPALSGLAMSSRSEIISGSWGLSTPGLDRTGDLQRVRLTSQPLEHGCSASRMSWGRALNDAHIHCHTSALWRARYICTIIHI